jgi:hypothetical protein
MGIFKQQTLPTPPTPVELHVNLVEPPPLPDAGYYADEELPAEAPGTTAREDYCQRIFEEFIAAQAAVDQAVEYQAEAEDVARRCAEAATAANEVLKDKKSNLRKVIDGVV